MDQVPLKWRKYFQLIWNLCLSILFPPISFLLIFFFHKTFVNILLLPQPNQQPPQLELGYFKATYEAD